MVSKAITYRSRDYHIVILEQPNGTAFVEVYCRRMYKHGIYKWRIAHKRMNDSFHEYFRPAHCLIDSAQDIIDYQDCLYKLRYSVSARRWFRQATKPYTDKYFK